MLDALNLDQLRTFVAAADEGNFSAAARRLLRAQSVVSQNISSFEALLGVVLFDRTGRYPKLTPAGQSLLTDAKAILAQVDAFKARSRGIASGLEAELSVVIDIMFPIAAVTQSVRAFAATFPTVPLRIYVEALGAVVQHLVDGRCSLGVVGSLPDVPEALRAERLVGMRVIMVAAPGHPLARIRGVISREDSNRHTQLIITDRTVRSEGRSFGVMSTNVWKLADLGAKHAFLLDGLGWGAMPIAVVEGDLAAGRLVALHLEDEPPTGIILPISIAYLKTSPPGPAGRWFINTLQACSRLHEADIEVVTELSKHSIVKETQSGGSSP